MARKHHNLLIPYVSRMAEISKTEAEFMITVVFTAMVHKLLETGAVALPFGQVVTAVSPRRKYPLRVKLYTTHPFTVFTNTGELLRPISLEEYMLPEHYEILKELQEKAYKYKKDKTEEFGNDKVQTDNS